MPPDIAGERLGLRAELLGDANWWLPRWLDRVLPRVAVEGEDLEATPPELETV